MNNKYKIGDFISFGNYKYIIIKATPSYYNMEIFDHDKHKNLVDNSKFNIKHHPLTNIFK